MKKRRVEVKNENGLHLRVAAKVIEVVKGHNATVSVVSDNCRRADGRSIMELIALGAGPGDHLELVVEGPDEDVVTLMLSEVFEEGAGI